MSDIRILVVDDEPFNLDIIADFLEEESWKIDTAENGEVALAMIESANPPYDLLLLDRMMPVMDGISLLCHLKTSDSAFRHLPVILQTAAGSPDQVREGLAVGAHYYLTKPFTKEVLLTIVRAVVDDVLQRRQLKQQLQQQKNVFHLLDRARFLFRTPDDVNDLSAALSLLSDHPGLTSMGLSELMLNAVEHGNLAFSYAEKCSLKRSNLWQQAISERLTDVRYLQRQASIDVCREEGDVVFVILDEGDGFDWRRYLDFDPVRACDPNGRGIALTRQMGIGLMEYNDKGNEVRLKISGSK